MAEPLKITQQDIKLGKRIAKARQNKGYTQEQLAEKIGVSLTWIGYIETAKRRPNLKMIYKIANAVGVKASDLIP